MIVENQFYDKYDNKSGKGGQHSYRYVITKGCRLIFDDIAGLVWQQSGSTKNIVGKDSAKNYIGMLNIEKFGGFSDWRLPILEEAMSLMESKQNKNGLYIDPIFDLKQYWIWTSDQRTSKWGDWFVSFKIGVCDLTHVGESNPYARAVRSIR